MGRNMHLDHSSHKKTSVVLTETPLRCIGEAKLMWGGNICLIEEEDITSGYGAHDDLMTPRYV